MYRMPSHFFARDTVDVARELLGKRFVSTLSGERIVGLLAETEAYQSDDPACHGFRGKTERTTALFGPVGRLYVYQSYGIHFCVNIVARSSSVSAGGVLVRGFIPLEGKEFLAHQSTKRLISGPGNTAKALSIMKVHNHTDLLTDDAQFRIFEGVSLNANDIAASPRIGISKAVDKLWRFYLTPKTVKTILENSSL